MIQSILGKKLGQSQGFLSDGSRIPMTRISVSGNVVSQIKTQDHEGYNAIQLGFGDNKKSKKPISGHSKKAGLTSTPRFFKETKADKIEDLTLGQEINAEEVLSAGDIVDVSGTSKGKGFAGVVKRHHFKGGPKTHGQSDRHRAPGAIGQGTTPGRVYKGKRMAGHMGVDQVTVKNLEVIDLADGILTVKGLVPGHISSIVTITRRGVNKKHVGLYKEPVAEEEIVEAKVEEIGPSVEEQEEMRKETEAKAEIEAKAEKEAAQVASQTDSAESSVEPKEGEPKVSEAEMIADAVETAPSTNVEEKVEEEVVVSDNEEEKKADA